MIEIVLQERDRRGNIIPDSKPSRFLGLSGKDVCRMVDRHLCRGVSKPYRGQSIDRFYCEGDFAIQAEEK